MRSRNALTIFSAVFIVFCGVMWSEMMGSVPIPNGETAGQDDLYFLSEKVMRMDVRRLALLNLCRK